MQTEERRSSLPFERAYLLTGMRQPLLRFACQRGVAPDALEEVIQETLLAA